MNNVFIMNGEFYWPSKKIKAIIVGVEKQSSWMYEFSLKQLWSLDSAPYKIS